MYRRIIWMVAGFGAAVLGAILFTRPESCYACAQSVPPPDCSVNMSAMTVRKADDRRAWWQIFDRREARTLRVYLGLNMNNGAAPLPYTYELVSDGAWLPASVTPITGSGQLSPGNNNATIEITIPYSTTDAGDLNLTANITSPCPFDPPSATTQVRINEQGPTVWPITSRACPVAGEKPRFRFGLRNPGEQPQTYNVTARALTQFGGDHTPILNSDGTQPGVYQFPDMELQPGQAQEVAVTCETFGFCLTGSESRVNLEVRPALGSSEQFDTALASSNITVRDPGASCPLLEDWWFIMPPLVFWGLVATPFLLGGAAAARYFWPTQVTEFKDKGTEEHAAKASATSGKPVDKGDKGGGPGGSGGTTRF